MQTNKTSALSKLNLNILNTPMMSAIKGGGGNGHGQGGGNSGQGGGNDGSTDDTTKGKPGGGG